MILLKSTVPVEAVGLHCCAVCSKENHYFDQNRTELRNENHTITSRLYLACCNCTTAANACCPGYTEPLGVCIYTAILGVHDVIAADAALVLFYGCCRHGNRLPQSRATQYCLRGNTCA